MKKRSIGRAVLMITQIGISMLAPIFLGAFIGAQMDRWLATGFFFVVFLVIGILAAFRNVYYLTKPFYAEDLKREQKEQEYWNSLKDRQQERKNPAVKDASDLAVSRRERERLAEKRQQEACQEDMAGGNEMLTAEEEFAAWRKRNGR